MWREPGGKSLFHAGPGSLRANRVHGKKGGPVGPRTSSVAGESPGGATGSTFIESMSWLRPDRFAKSDGVVCMTHRSVDQPMFSVRASCVTSTRARAPCAGRARWREHSPHRRCAAARVRSAGSRTLWRWLRSWELLRWPCSARVPGNSTAAARGTTRTTRAAPGRALTASSADGRLASEFPVFKTICGNYLHQRDICLFRLALGLRSI